MTQNNVNRHRRACRLMRMTCVLITTAAALAVSGCETEENFEAKTPEVAEQIKKLKEGKPEEREQAIAVLAKANDPAVVAPLITAARTDTQRYLRVAAIRALRRPELVTSAKPLYALLKDPEAEVRAVTCETLAVLKPANAEGPLAECLTDRDSIVRTAAIQALSHLGPTARARVEPLIESGTVEDRVAVIQMIAEIGDRERVPKLMATLQANDDTIRRAAVDALGALGDERAVPALVELIKNPLSPSRREEFTQRRTTPLMVADRNAMVVAIDEMLIAQGQAPKGPKEHQWVMSGDSSAHRNMFNRVIDKQLKTTENVMRVGAAEALAKIDTPAARDALMGFLADDDSGIGTAVVQSLSGGNKGNGVLIELVRDTTRPAIARQRALDLLLVDDKKPDVAIGTETMLKAFDGETEDIVVRVGPGSGDFIRILPLSDKVKETLVQLLTDKDEGLRARAAAELAVRKMPEALEPLLGLVSNPDQAIKNKAVRGLANYTDPRIVEPLLTLLKSEKDPAARVTIITALGSTKDKRATPALLKVATEWNDGQTQSSALLALARIGDPAAGQPLYTIYQESEKRLAEAQSDKNAPRRGPGSPSHQNHVRRMAVEAMGTCRATAATNDLLALIGKTSRDEVEEAAWIALAHLGETRAIDKICARLVNGPHRKKDERNVNYTTQAGADALVIFNNAKAVPTLEKLVRTPPDGATREYATRALGKITQPEAVDALLRMLVDPTVELAVKETGIAPAIAANGKLSRPHLAKMLVETPEPSQGNRFDAGIYAAQLLSSMAPDSLADFETAAGSDKRYVLARVIEGTGRIADDRAVVILEKLLKSKDAAVRQLAAVALGRSRQATAIPALKPALNDSDAEVVRWTRWALEKHGVQP